MAGYTHHLAGCYVSSVRLGVWELQKVRRYRAPIVFSKTHTDVVTGWTLLRLVELFRVLDQFLHAIAVGHQHAANIGFGPFRFAEPPKCVDRVFGAHLALVYPLDGAGQPCRVVPVKLLGQMETKVV